MASASAARQSSSVPSAHARFDSQRPTPSGPSTVSYREPPATKHCGAAPLTHAQLLAKNAQLEAQLQGLSSLNEELLRSAGLSRLQEENARLRAELDAQQPPHMPAGLSAADAARLDSVAAEALARFDPTPPLWTAERWVASLAPEHELSSALLRRLRERTPDARLERGFLCALGGTASEAMVLALLREAGVLEALADKARRIWRALANLSTANTSTPPSPAPSPMVAASLASIEARTAAYGGMEAALGYGPPDSRDAMRIEHCDGSDAALGFTPAGFDTPTTSEIEYWYVADPDGGLARLRRNAWPGARPAPQRAPRVQAVCAELNERLRRAGEREVGEREVVAARLYTGPMAAKYDAALRAVHAAAVVRPGASPAQRATEHAKQEWHRLCKENTYRCTLRLLNSAIVKLSKLSTPQPLFCVSLDSELLPYARGDQPLRRSDDVLLGTAIVHGFTSKPLVVDYALRSPGGRVLQLDAGAVGRSANLGQLASPPHDGVHVFPPLTAFELSGCHAHGPLTVLELRVAATAEWQRPGLDRHIEANSQPPDGQWAAKVLKCSSEYDDDLWSASQLLGPPKVYPAYGDITGVWAAAGNGERPHEFVELEFESPMYVSALEIYETYRPGACVRVCLHTTAGGWDEVWRGRSEQDRLPAVSRVFSPPLQWRGYPTTAVRIDICAPTNSAGPAQVDAVRLLGYLAPPWSVEPRKVAVGASDRRQPSRGREQGIWRITTAFDRP
ncbi:hypothetical protein AB1Y20_005404 [Prymnesium parvum]|uniref:Pappalysin-1 SD scarf domain-containing protein n=1 Tax=Prymnesium parvum TaxID=97485 RepID=A0AB34J6E9_PRYPA